MLCAQNLSKSPHPLLMSCFSLQEARSLTGKSIHLFDCSHTFLVNFIWSGNYASIRVSRVSLFDDSNEMFKPINSHEKGLEIHLLLCKSSSGVR